MREQDSDLDDATLSDWRAATTAFLVDEDTGRLATRLVHRLRALGLAALAAEEAERIAFAAVTHLLAGQLPPRLGALRDVARWDDAAAAMAAFGAIQDWSVLTGRDPFAAALSQTPAEALERYREARMCERIADEFEVGERTAVLCWVRAANRAAFRAVMMEPDLLLGEDALAEEMLRIAAAEHIARLGRTPQASRLFGDDEVAAVHRVEEAVRQASRRAIEHQRTTNLRRTGGG